MSNIKKLDVKTSKLVRELLLEDSDSWLNAILIMKRNDIIIPDHIEVTLNKWHQFDKQLIASGKKYTSEEYALMYAETVGEKGVMVELNNIFITHMS